MAEFLRNKSVSLAPLVGGSDLAFRLLARRYGAQVTYTPMCVARYYNDTKARDDFLFEFDARDRPLMLQLTDTEAQPIIELANNPMFEGHIDGIDLNFGCPQLCAQRGVFGAFLVEKRGMDHAVQLVADVVRGVSLPVTVKMRLFKDLDSTQTFVRRLFDAGAAAVTLHGRYHYQKNTNRGVADWEAVDAVKKANADRIVIGNGDIRTYEQLQERLQSTLADGVMIGYGALRDPTVFSPDTIPLQQVVQEYIDLARVTTNRLIDVKRHVGWLIKHHTTKLERFQLFSAATLDELVACLASLTQPITVHLPPPSERVNDKVGDDRPAAVPTDAKLRKRQRQALKRAAKRNKRTLERLQKKNEEEIEEKDEDKDL